MLRITILLIVGITLGRIADIPFFFSIGERAYSTSALLVSAILCFSILAVIQKRNEVISSILISCAVLSTGVLLIERSDLNAERDYDTMPAIYRFSEFMDEKRTMLSETYREQGIEKDEYAIISAMTLGEKQHIDRDLRNTYNISGASHIFALSGLHLGILCMIITLLLPRRRFPVVSSAILLVTIWSFVALVGSHASIIRAALMLTIYSICMIASRKVDNMSVLTFTAFLLLVCNPEYLFDIGFQMSFMAVVAILLVYSPISRAIAIPWRIPRYLFNITLISFAANLGVAPLIAHYFGRISTYGLIANIVVSPCAFVIIMLALAMFLLVMLSAYLPFLSILLHAVSWMLYNVVHFMNSFLEWVASLPYSSFENVSLNTTQTILVYIVISCTYLLFWKRFSND